MIQLLIKVIFIFIAVAGLTFYYNVSKASRITMVGEVPSEDKIYELQYCLTDEDCQLVEWDDCSDCQYVEAVNKDYAQYFHDNADYFNYPIGFNRAYCHALSKLIDPEKLNKINYRVDCRYDTPKEKVIASKCDPLIKQCYSICQDAIGSGRKCQKDTYINKFFQIFIEPFVYKKQA